MGRGFRSVRPVRPPCFDSLAMTPTSGAQASIRCPLGAARPRELGAFRDRIAFGPRCPNAASMAGTRPSGPESFTARALFVAAMNPCHCGYLGHPRRGCRCTPSDIAQHHARISGPILDRIDLQLEVPALTAAEIQSASPGESSAAVRARVLATRERQRARGCLNALLPPARLSDCCGLDTAGRRLVTDAVDRAGFSARAVHRAMRVARTIADLAGDERISVRALAEALQYRAYEARRFAVR